MSSLTPETKSVFLVQSGVIAWEDPKPIADWRWKTISICAARLQYLVSIVFELISLHPPRSLFRFHSSPVPANTGVAQKRNLIQSLCKDSPGFKGSYVSSTRDRICIASELANPLELGLNYLSAYRSTILLAAGSNTNSPEDLCNSLCGIVPDFGGASIAQLLDHSLVAAKLTFFEKLPTSSSIEISCYLRIGEEIMPVIGFDKQSLKLIAAIGASIDIDIALDF